MTFGADDPAREPLVLLAHGSPDPRHRQGVEALAARVRRLDPGRPVTPAYLDHHGPTPSEVAADLPSAAVVPVLLTRAYHARVDVPAAAASMGAGFVAADPLGPDPALLQGIEELLVRGGVDPDPDTTIVLYAAGSSDSAAVTTIAETAREHAPPGWGPWVVAALDGGSTLPEVLTDVGDGPVRVVSFMVAEGILRDRMATACTEAGVPFVPGTLGDTDAVAGLALRRADEEATSLPG